MNERIEALEERIAHLIRTVEELSDIVATQADRIDLLDRRVAMLIDKVATPEEGGHLFTDERPPHW
ncbi:MAG: SlyX family protein [Pseudorhodobacter sp.]